MEVYVRRFLAGVMLVTSVGIAGCPMSTDRSGSFDDFTVTEEPGADTGGAHGEDDSGSGGASYHPPDDLDPPDFTTSAADQDGVLGGFSTGPSPPTVNVIAPPRPRYR